MPGSQLAVLGFSVGRGALDAWAEEALEVFGFQFGGDVAVDFGLVFDEEVEPTQVLV